MKKLLLIAFGAALFFGCSKKDNSSQNSIVGKWYAESDSSAIYQNGTLYDHESETFDHQDYEVFNSDGTGTEVDIKDLAKPYSLNFTYSKSGNNLSINIPAHTEDNVSYDAYTLKGTIKILTDSKLQFVVEDTEVSNGDTYRTVITYNLIK